MGAGRPSNPVGTWGTFATRQVPSGAFRSRTRIRDHDGVVREVSATGTTKPAAERALRLKLTERSAPREQLISDSTTVSGLGHGWIKFLRAEGRIENSTINEYERVLVNVIVPELGGLRIKEVTTGRLDSFLLRLRTVSTSRQRKTKVVLGLMFSLAVRHDALQVNPAQQTSRIQRDRPEVRSLTAEDLTNVRLALKKWATDPRPGPRASTDMADIVEVMLGSGARIGEVLALRWKDIDLQATPPTLTVRGTIKTEKGKGTYRKPHPKTESSVRTTALPAFAADALRRRLNNA